MTICLSSKLVLKDDDLKQVWHSVTVEHLEGQALYREMKSLIKGSMLLCVNSAEWCLNYILSESYNNGSRDILPPGI